MVPRFGNLKWTCDILSMGAAGPRGKTRTLVATCFSWWTTSGLSSPKESSSDLSLPWSMVASEVTWSWPGDMEETSIGPCTIESIELLTMLFVGLWAIKTIELWTMVFLGLWATVQEVELRLEPEWVSCNLGRCGFTSWAKVCKWDQGDVYLDIGPLPLWSNGVLGQSCLVSVNVNCWNVRQ